MPRKRKRSSRPSVETKNRAMRAKASNSQPVAENGPVVQAAQDATSNAGVHDTVTAPEVSDADDSGAETPPLLTKTPSNPYLRSARPNPKDFVLSNGKQKGESNDKNNTRTNSTINDKPPPSSTSSNTSTQQALNRLTISAPLPRPNIYTYIHLKPIQHALVPEANTNSATRQPRSKSKLLIDNASLRLHLLLALSSAGGDFGAAIPIDILINTYAEEAGRADPGQRDTIVVRVYSDDAGILCTALAGWSGTAVDCIYTDSTERSESAHDKTRIGGYTVANCSPWLACLMSSGGDDTGHNADVDGLFDFDAG